MATTLADHDQKYKDKIATIAKKCSESGQARAPVLVDSSRGLL
jgi:hypothetical protein